jgi:hypothetical protein
LTYVFASAANNECLVWNPKEHIHNTELQEVIQPDKIIDFGSSENIEHLTIQEVE